MKFHESHFEEYVQTCQKQNLHNAIDKVIKKFPSEFKNLKNMIFFGPCGVGKYSIVLKSIKKYSPSELKYEKKISIIYNKVQYFLKISDIHYEVDLSLLGCNSKLLWHEIYVQIIDIISAKTNKNGIIVCKNFHDIHSELLENFYSYMQQNTSAAIDLKFIIISEQISFIPDNILNCCEVINVARPSKTNYEKCLNKKIYTPLNHISNIKSVNSNVDQLLMQPYKLICNKIINVIIDNENCKFLKLRDLLYDMFIYNLDISECIWYILHTLVVTLKKIKQENVSDILIKTYTFFQYYNNNYRPIYHVENYVLFLSTMIKKE
jgi:hypothetical protein